MKIIGEPFTDGCGGEIRIVDSENGRLNPAQRFHLQHRVEGIENWVYVRAAGCSQSLKMRLVSLETGQEWPNPVEASQETWPEWDVFDYPDKETEEMPVVYWPRRAE